MPITRRDFCKTSVASSALLLASQGVLPSLALGKESGSPAPRKLNSTFTLAHTLKPLAFDPKKLNGISERMIQSHWENNYGGSVKTLNTIRKKMAEAIYGAAAAKYIDAFFQNINWEIVEARIEKARSFKRT